MYNRSFGLDRFRKAQTTSFQVDEIHASTSAASAPPQAGESSPAGRDSRLAQPQQGGLAAQAPSLASAPAGTPPVVSYLPGTAPASGILTAAAGVGGVGGAGEKGAAPDTPTGGANPHATTVGGGQSTWQPPEWAVDPWSSAYYLEVSKDGQAVDKIPLDKKRTIFGRQQPMCDFVLDHPSVSRQHAAVLHHKNRSLFVIDLGSAHGTFVSNERLKKDIPVEIEVGQSLRFAASTRTYILRKSQAPPKPPPPPQLPPDVQMPSRPDPSNAEAVLEYNTLMNRLGHPVVGAGEGKEGGGEEGEKEREGRKRKRDEGGALPGFASKSKVRFRDEHGGILVEVVGFSDGFDVSTEPGPVGVREGGSLVGKFDSLVQTVVIPRGQPKGGAATASPTLSSLQAQGEGSGKALANSSGVSKELRAYLGKALAKTQGLYGSLGGEESGVVKRETWARGGMKKAIDEIGNSNGSAENEKPSSGDGAAGYYADGAAGYYADGAAGYYGDGASGYGDGASGSGDGASGYGDGAFF